MEVMIPRLTRRRAFVAAAAAGLGLPAAASAAEPVRRGGDVQPLRAATYNVSMHRGREGQLLEDLAGGEDAQIRAVAEVIQINNPDILLLN